MKEKTMRIQQILDLLISNDSFVSASDLATKCNCSVRTIYNILNSPEFIECLHGAYIEKRQNKGVRLIFDAKQKNSIMLNLNVSGETSSSYSDDEEKSVLLSLLLTAEPQTINNISDIVYRSSNSTSALLDHIEQFIKPYNCSLIRKQNVGIFINGKESDQRALLNQLISAELSDNFDRETVIFTLSKYYDKEDILKTEKIITAAETSMNSRFVGPDYYNLLISLLIIIIRIRMNNYVEAENTISTNIQEFYIASFIRMYLTENFFIHLPDEEVIYIEKILLSLRRQNNNYLMAVFDETIVKTFINQISDHLNIDLTSDAQLKNNLISHLKPAIKRMRYGISNENPLIDKIKEKYTEVYVAIITSIDYIEETEGIYFDANEIGYVALHIVAAINRLKQTRTVNTILICDSGLTFETYLKSLIENTFNEISINSIIYSTEYFSLYKDKSYDLVLNSTSSIITGKNVVTIDQLLSEKSCSDIRHWLVYYNRIDDVKLVNEIYDYLLFFHDQLTYESPESFINRYCDFLLQNKYITKEYTSTVIDRMHKSATAIGRGVAVPHGAKKYVTKSIIIAIKLEHPINWENQLVDFVFFAVIGDDVSGNYKQLFRLISRIVADDEKTNELKSCNSIDSIKSLLFEQN